MKNRDSDPDKDMNRFRILNADPATIPKYIKNSSYGDHSLVLYPSLEQFEEFYIECCKDSILERNEIFILLTYYQHVSAVRKKMHLLAGIDAAKYEDDGTLVILDSEKAYRASVEQTRRNNFIIILTNVLMKNTEERDKKGITLVIDQGSFILNKRLSELISHEASLLNSLDANIRCFCCYHKKDFSVLQEEQIKGIFKHHSNNLVLA
jgi:hypothetical protein